MSSKQWLFSYGTLQLERVQQETFGRKLEGHADVLSGYHLATVTIANEQVLKTSGCVSHPIAYPTGCKEDTIKGMVFELSADEIKQADEYEVSDYQRISVRLASGKQAWVFVGVKEPVDG